MLSPIWLGNMQDIREGELSPSLFYVCLTWLKKCRTIHLYGRVLVTFCETEPTLSFCGKSVNSHPRKREYARHLSHGALRSIQVAGLQVFRDQPLISLTPAAVKAQFLILVSSCAMQLV